MLGEAIGSYVVESKLGEGGMGEVYLGRHRSLETPAAIKVMSPAFSHDPRLHERFSREAKTQAQLRHPNIVQVLDHVEHAGRWYLIVEYLPHGSVEDALKKRPDPLPIEAAVAWARQALAGLGHAHRHGVVHRDIKPANLLINERGEAAVTDFGIALEAGLRRLTQTGVSIGTPEYMSPEQIRGAADLDHRTDIYSMGVVLYELLAHRVPFEAESMFEVQRAQVSDPPPPLRSVAPQVPEALEAVVLRALAKDPADRFASCSEMAAALGAEGPNLPAAPAFSHRRTVLEPTAPPLSAPSPSMPPSSTPSSSTQQPPEGSRVPPFPQLSPAAPPTAISPSSPHAPPPAAPPRRGTVALAPTSPTLTSPAPAPGPAMAPASAPRQGRGRWLAAGAAAFVGLAVGAVFLDGGGDSGEDPQVESAPADPTEQNESPGPEKTEVENAAAKSPSAPKAAEPKVKPKAAAPPALPPVRPAPAALPAESKAVPPPGIPPGAPPGLRAGMPTPAALPSKPVVAVLAVGDPLMAAAVEATLEKRLHRGGFDVQDELNSLELAALLEERGSKVSMSELLPILVRDGFHVVVVVKVEEGARRRLAARGQNISAIVARLRLTAHLLPTRRAIGRGWSEKVEYTELSAEAKGRKVFQRATAELVPAIRDSWTTLRGGA